MRQKLHYNITDLNVMMINTDENTPGRLFRVTTIDTKPAKQYHTCSMHLIDVTGARMGCSTHLGIS